MDAKREAESGRGIDSVGVGGEQVDGVSGACGKSEPDWRCAECGLPSGVMCADCKRIYRSG